MTVTTARTITTAVRRALRVANVLDQHVFKVNTQESLDNVPNTDGRGVTQVPVWSTVVELYDTAKTDIVADALTAAGFTVRGKSSSPWGMKFVSLQAPREVEQPAGLEPVDSDVRALVAELNRPARLKQRAVLVTLAQETARDCWRNNIVPTRALGPHAASAASALDRQGLADRRTLPHKGYKITELGKRVASLIVPATADTPQAPARKPDTAIEPTPEQEATDNVEFLRPLVTLALLPDPTEADWNAARPGATLGDTVLVRDRYDNGKLRYGRVIARETARDRQLIVNWLTRAGLIASGKRVPPEVHHPDYAEMRGRNGRHIVVAQYALAHRLRKLTEQECRDREGLRARLGDFLPAGTDPVAYVERVLRDDDDNRDTGVAPEDHMREAYDSSYRVALVEQRTVQAFPLTPGAAFAPRHGGHFDHDAVRVVDIVL
ncbi:MAG: hypothetical protein HOY78_02565 [Saccharothrix sp.]|nr:hypothetical protein [Saccharothrix sp.]